MRKLAYCAGGFSAAIFLAHFLLPARWVLPGALAAVVLALVTLLLPGQTRRRVMAALLSAAIGFGWYAAASALRLTPAQNVSGDVQTVTARVTEYPVAYERSYGLTVLLTSPDVPNCKARLYVSDADAAALRPGDEITADVKFRPSTLRYGEETDSYISKGIYLIGSVRDKTLARTGVWSRSWLYWPKTVAQSLKTSAQAAFPADVLPFAQALMLGDKSALYAQDLDIPLSTTGIMHTVAVSGLHLAFLLGFLRLFTGNRRTTAIIGLPMMVVFVVMAGCSPSVLRAAFMTALVLLRRCSGGRNDPPTSLLTALAILLAANPFAAASISLQLSFASMAGLFCVSGALYRALDARLLPADVKLSRPRRKIRAFFSATTASSVGAMVFTVPLTALHFGNISLIAPVTNLLILWLLPAAFIGCYLAALLGLVWAWGGMALAWVTAWPLRYILAVANVLSKLPGCSAVHRQPHGRLVARAGVRHVRRGVAALPPAQGALLDSSCMQRAGAVRGADRQCRAAAAHLNRDGARCQSGAEHRVFQWAILRRGGLRRPLHRGRSGRPCGAQTARAGAPEPRPARAHASA